MEFKNLSLTQDGRVGIIAINRPKALNALNTKVLLELDAVLDELEKNPEVYVIVLTGEGKAFVAGADIEEMKDMTPDEARKFAELGSRVFKKLEIINKPVIAAVNGYALGGGCELAMACDIIIAGEQAKFGQPETGLGITPGFGGTQRLPRIVGTKRAKEIIFTGEIIGAEEAYRIGLVNKVVPPNTSFQAAIEMAKKIASKGQIAVRNAKAAINRGIETDIDGGVAIENQLFALCFANTDQKEGMTAFIEKRKADFKN
ncbi:MULTISPECIES: short-chain-enoyl-CoA hydratase [Lutispora]|uniref:Short-chain-enoyl-CoA hydratase n=1 Tax=Lutispora saccharofermentans TaxID=3024236 RepID=A0ABT1NEG6_9FIRM|nr:MULTISPECIES: short-chain-enoyl-CoA hydratase [Lutispora]MCQ1528741.1 short-chain-enoyl-CoA hydratase [Lutispora saccharofermentans]MEA4961958.1 short-chain-enoyl-CoA hydratase [Lutispora sp.]HCJ56564.1 crotonase [Clostridiaceae bacterium]